MEPQALRSQTLLLRERISSLGGIVREVSTAVSSCSIQLQNWWPDSELSGDVAVEGGDGSVLRSRWQKRRAFSH